MLSFFRFPPLLTIFCTVLSLYSTVALSQTDFNEGYEAAQAGNYQAAIAKWRPLAEQGDVAAQYTLGWMFESGQGVPQSYKQAAMWYTKAAMQGNLAAQYVLASMYNKGTGLPVDKLKAIQWFTKAANQGDAVAQFQLGVLLQKGEGINQNFDKSLWWFAKAAEQGHITSQINLGKIYQSGRGVKQDYKKAIQWYEKAAAQNNALGFYHLAQMYEYGRGVPKDLLKAKSLYLKSATNHYAPSAYKVAEFYELGKGVDINYKSAMKWYKKAANKGNSNAQFKLGNLYKDGKGSNKNIRAAIDWYVQAANQDHSRSHYHLGVIYEDGVKNKYKAQTINVNHQKAFKHFQRASELHLPSAHARLAEFYEKGLGVEKDLAKAAELYKQADQGWAVDRYQSISKRLACFKTATTKLFSVSIACTTRAVLREKIKEKDIAPLNENIDHWSDTYFTGAVIRGSSQLQVTYTREDDFVSAKYIFVGRNKPTLITSIKNKIAEKYGEPDKHIGMVSKGPASFEWFLDDGIQLIISRDWPNTTTFVQYLLPEKQKLLEAQQAQSPDKTYIAAEQKIDIEIESDLF